MMLLSEWEMMVLLFGTRCRIGMIVVRIAVKVKLSVDVAADPPFLQVACSFRLRAQLSLFLPNCSSSRCRRIVVVAVQAAEQKQQSAVHMHYD